MEKHSYNPDVLNCLANLSNDEVFTPPELANRMLDLLPQELFSDPKSTFLDPFSKSGVFLREVVKRLDIGLAKSIPDRRQRIDHIMHHQVYGIAITELTAHLSRRSLYCSRCADSPYSVSHFDSPEGNIQYRPLQHTWQGGKCRYCGASQSVYDRPDTAEQHAYQFIHTDNPQTLFPKDMKFDVIIGNPPYQMNVGVEKENYAIAIYDKFVLQAKKLNPHYLIMIIPARWYAGGRGLDDFRDEMLHDKHISHIVDYPNSTDCFPGVDLAGGVCVFKWDFEKHNEVQVDTYKGTEMVSSMRRPLLEKKLNTFIRHNQAITILRKVQSHDEETFDKIVGPQTPFGLVSSFRDFKENPFDGCIKYYTYGHEGYLSMEQVRKNKHLVAPHKVYISKAYGERGDYPYLFLGKPFYGEPNSCCSQTYLVIGPFSNKVECDNVQSYIRTRFFRCMVMLKKNAQDNMSYVFGCVPLQDFSHPWTDEMLYEKYGLDKQEIAFIDSMIRPME